MTDPIRAALDVAAEAVRGHMRAPDSCCPEVCDSGPCICTRDAARAAIAAFLRALPNHVIVQTMKMQIGTFDGLAAAVEAARDVR